MFHPFGSNRLLLATAAALASGALALLDVASAHAQNLATCQFETHVALSGGSFSSDGASNVDCHGMIGGTLAASGGMYAVQGRYSGNACTLSSWQGRFEAQIPQAIYFFDPQYAVLDGSLQLMRAGQMLVASGGGIVDGDRISYAGAGSFTPDGGQGCGATAGTLSVQVAIVDGGSVSNAQSTGSASGQQSVTHTPRHRHRYHGRHHHSRRAA
jgi:hypothetical protein